MENLRGAAWMTLAMLVFAIEDMFIKLLSEALPTWQIIAIIGAGGASVFGLAAKWQGQALFPAAALSAAVLVRNTGELVGSLAFVTAIALIPLSSASAILQATPLVVTLGAALFLGEAVGWRRWTAILVGFAGVLLIIRPGLEGFDIRSLFAVLAVIGLALRDLATRRIPATVSSIQLSFLAFLTLVPAAFGLAWATGAPAVQPQGLHWALIGCTISFGVLAYYAIVTAMRVGEISFVTPFRYSRILFALIIGMAVFGERPDALMLIGAAFVVSSGLFTLWRERKHRSAA
ncbi:DMT family transporter [Aestuariivita sp.]|jgi:drug/metabolite transporter (DMT)-like permease|uniref:DMT family transporter n=1 Tax=Aestuariivita sp. TaxID=1872407 RepID=UPI00216F33BC|nr:DMT family transporter [Aestuariivita sp.]MCE8009291.1 DMT family transporter [Aestuariivita sp.]